MALIKKQIGKKTINIAWIIKIFFKNETYF